MLASRVRMGVNTGVELGFTGYGNENLLRGTGRNGYFGEVPRLTMGRPFFIDRLFYKLGGLTSGTESNWVKFAIDGKILFIPKLPIRDKLSYNTLNNLGLIEGKNIYLYGLEYKIRVFNEVTPSNPYINDWDRTLVKIHEDYNIWDNYSNASLGINSITGSATNRIGSYDTTIRGRGTVDNSFYPSPSGNMANWRPVLELVSEGFIQDTDSQATAKAEVVNGNIAAFGASWDMSNPSFESAIVTAHENYQKLGDLARSKVTFANTNKLISGLPKLR